MASSGDWSDWRQAQAYAGYPADFAPSDFAPSSSAESAWLDNSQSNHVGALPCPTNEVDVWGLLDPSDLSGCAMLMAGFPNLPQDASPHLHTPSHKPQAAPQTGRNRTQRSKRHIKTTAGIHTFSPPPTIPSPLKCKWEGCSDQRSFTREHELVCHLKTAHITPGRHPYPPRKCKWEGCRYQHSFTRENDLVRHLRNLHITPGSHPCLSRKCSKIFNRKDNLQKHIKKHH